MTFLKVRPVPLLPRINEAERAAYDALIATLGDKAIWLDYTAADAAMLPSAASGGGA
jgi:DNA polymerase III subunit epsilon